MVKPPYSTLYVPASAIYPRLVQWGYIDQSTPVEPSPKMLVDTPVTTQINQPVNTCDCDCTAKFAAIESRIETLTEAMKARQDAGDTGAEARKQIAALNEQIIILRTELDALKPLLRREVILVSDGEITSKRSLKPSDPIVLGSEIVVRKNAGK
jgi:hypothetical protein